MNAETLVPKDQAEPEPKALIDLFCIDDVRADLSYVMVSLDRSTFGTYKVTYRAQTQDCCCTAYSAKSEPIAYTEVRELLLNAVEDPMLRKLRSTDAYELVRELSAENVEQLIGMLICL